MHQGEIDSMEGMLATLREGFGLGEKSLALRILSQDKYSDITSGVIILRPVEGESDYLWVELTTRSVICHSSRFHEGPFASDSRYSFGATDPDLSANLKSAIQYLLLSRNLRPPDHSLTDLSRGGAH